MPAWKPDGRNCDGPDDHDRRPIASSALAPEFNPGIDVRARPLRKLQDSRNALICHLRSNGRGRINGERG